MTNKIKTNSIADSAITNNKLAPQSITQDKFDSSVVLVPRGCVMTFAMQTAPSGWLACNGQAVSRIEYAGLFSLIGTLYGIGNGTSTFNLPDLRGEFVRGWDNGRGIDIGRTFGSIQLDELRSHTHIPQLNSYDWDTGNSSYNRIGGSLPTGPTRNANIETTATGGVETRPRNVAMLYCIKF